MVPLPKEELTTNYIDWMGYFMKRAALIIATTIFLTGCTQSTTSDVYESTTEAFRQTSVVETQVTTEEETTRMVQETEPEEFIVTFKPDPERLSALANEKGMYVGTAFDLKYYKRAPYYDVVTNEFNTITMENMMKWASMNPAKDRYIFSGIDVATHFAKEHGMKMRGHTLVWHQQLPAWLTQKSGQWTKQELLDIIDNYVENMVEHFRGSVYTWDVLNEIFEEDGSFRASMWYKYTGEEYIRLALTKAREVDPEALLIINDYNVATVNPKSDGLYKLVKQLQEEGVPIDGVGFQCHFVLDQIDYDSMIENIERFEALGLEVQLTEIDIRMASPVTEDKLQRQGDSYKKLMEIALEHNITTFVVWGVSDAISWVPGFFVGYSTPLLFDRDYAPKPAYDGVYEALSNHLEE